MSERPWLEISEAGGSIKGGVLSLGPDRGAVIVDGVGRRRDEADERLAVGAGEGLRDDVGAGWVDGGGGVAILHLHRCALKRKKQKFFSVKIIKSVGAFIFKLQAETPRIFINGIRKKVKKTQIQTNLHQKNKCSNTLGQKIRRQRTAVAEIAAP